MKSGPVRIARKRRSRREPQSSARREWNRGLDFAIERDGRACRHELHDLPRPLRQRWCSSSRRTSTTPSAPTWAACWRMRDIANVRACRIASLKARTS